MNPTARQTAIVLAGLPAAERDWVLQHLAPERASQMGTLVDEAMRLGVRADAALLGDLMDALDRRASPDDARAHVARAHPAQLVALLNDAPPLLIARLLKAHPWRWKEAFLARLAGSQRRDVMDAMRVVESELESELENEQQGSQSSAAAPAAIEAIVEELARRLRAQPRLSGRPAPSTRVAHLAGLIKAFPIIGKTRGAR